MTLLGGPLKRPKAPRKRREEERREERRLSGSLLRFNVCLRKEGGEKVHLIKRLLEGGEKWMKRRGESKGKEIAQVYLRYNIPPLSLSPGGGEGMSKVALP